MKQMGIFKIVAATALAVGVFTSSAASAAPAVSPQALATQTDANVQLVRDGRHGGWRGHRRGHRGGGWGWGAAAAAGLLLAAPYAYSNDDGYGYDDDDYDGSYAYRGGYGGGEARCEATFRSYDPNSGTYMGYDGIRRACPYL